MTTEPIRYYARQIYVENYPSCGSLQWCCLDSRGHYHVCRNEQSAVAEAMRRNAQSKTEETTTMFSDRVAIEQFVRTILSQRLRAQAQDDDALAQAASACAETGTAALWDAYNAAQAAAERTQTPEIWAVWALVSDTIEVDAKMKGDSHPDLV